MDATTRFDRRGGLLYPMMVIAAISLIVFSIVGIATMTGTLPRALSTPAQPDAAARGADGSQADVSGRPAGEPVLPKRDRPYTAAPDGAAKQGAACVNCGTVLSVRAVAVAGQPSMLGAVAGGVLGGVLGNQVGRGNGRTAMTVVGAGAGAYAGNEIEKNMNRSVRWQVRVRMNDGSVRTFHQASEPSWQVGQRVRLSGRNIVAAG